MKTIRCFSQNSFPEKGRILLGIASFLVCQLPLLGQLETVPEKEKQSLFPGDQTITVILHNKGDAGLTARVAGRLYQTASTVAVPVTIAPSKEIQILGGQTVIESIAFTFPEVKVQTRFLIQWVENTNRIIGKSEVMIYPNGLLKDLKSLCDGEPLGILDPEAKLKPLLRDAGVEVFDFHDEGFESYHGTLAIVGPFDSPTQVSQELVSQIKRLSTLGVGIVWAQPPSENPTTLTPSFYSVSEGKGSVVIVQPGLLSDLAKNPRAQRNLVELARIASHPSQARLPFLANEQ